VHTAQLDPCWLTLTVTAFFGKDLATVLVPKMRTCASISLRGSRRLPFREYLPVIQGTMQDQIA